jgi:hypothetical protein
MVIFLVAVCSVFLHVGIGWEATIVAGLLGGMVWHDRWPQAAAGVLLGWILLVIYTPIVAPAAFRVLVDTLGAFAGNIPGEAVVGLTVLLGGILGGIGASAGRVLRLLADPDAGTVS